MESMTTESVPVRYVAFDNPRVWVTHTCDIDTCRYVDRSPKRPTPLGALTHGGGFEYAAYGDPMPGRIPGHPDGIFIEILSYQGRDYLLRALATRPSVGREQLGHVERYPTYQLAKDAALRWLPEAEAFCKKGEKHVGVHGG